MLASTVGLALCRASGWSRREDTMVSAATPCVLCARCAGYQEQRQGLSHRGPHSRGRKQIHKFIHVTWDQSSDRSTGEKRCWGRKNHIPIGGAAVTHCVLGCGLQGFSGGAVAPAFSNDKGQQSPRGLVGFQGSRVGSCFVTLKACFHAG